MPDPGPEKHRQMLRECNNFHYAVGTCLERPLRRNDKSTQGKSKVFLSKNHRTQRELLPMLKGCENGVS